MAKEENTKQDVVVQYKDGGFDRYYGATVVSFKDGVLEIKESNSRSIYIVLDEVSWWTKEAS